MKRPKRQANTTQRLIDCKQIEVEYGIPARTIYDLFVTGRLPGIQIGRRLWFERADVDGFIATSKQHRGGACKE